MNYINDKNFNFSVNILFIDFLNYFYFKNE